MTSPADLDTGKKVPYKTLVAVVIETARSARNKMAYDEDLGAFRLKKVLPEGMTFPYDFGFVPLTLADDGDPIDALVLMDEPATRGPRRASKLVDVAAQRWRKKNKRRHR